MFPETMGYSGEVSFEGERFSGGAMVMFSLHDAASGGEELWFEEQNITITDGQLRAQLGATSLLDGVFDGTPMWLQITIDGNALSPRTYVGSQPYAWRADTARDAVTLEGKSVQEILSKIPIPTSDAVSFDDSRTMLGRTDSQGAIEEIVSRLARLEQTVSAQDTELRRVSGELARAKSDVAMLSGELALATTRVASLESELSATRVDVAAHTVGLAGLNELTQDITRTTINGARSLVFDSVNIHVRSGAGATNGNPALASSVDASSVATNGLGNVIIGYDEPGLAGSSRTGSHNLVVGSRHNYSSFGGIVVGDGNTISAPFASVSGGLSNSALSSWASVSGGSGNRAWDLEASVAGGFNNTASGQRASVCGGSNNRASGLMSSVLGGSSNLAEGTSSTVSGGSSNRASGSSSSVSGGSLNIASGLRSSVTGGSEGIASGISSSLSGGERRTVTGPFDWRAGAFLQDF